MSNSELVRTSRDGDQFHYLWAARRCLELLSSKGDLTAISIEGASSNESGDSEAMDAGEQVIDVGEYYGSDNLEKARLIRYVQLKHSTKHADVEWSISGLSKTLRGFADRFTAIRAKHSHLILQRQIRFCFTTNRPIEQKIYEALREVASGEVATDSNIYSLLVQYTSLTGEELQGFCALFELDGGHQGYLDQRKLLAQGLRAYLPGADVDSPLQMKELVTRKATSEYSGNPQIKKSDVLLALNTAEEDLFPAGCMIELPSKVIPREQEAELAGQIRKSAGAPVVIQADGGVGKSIFAMRIANHMPPGSFTVVYDCFGNGQYRSPSGYRHRSKDALVQISNELAAAALCDPLIRSAHADSQSYIRAFLVRLEQAVQTLLSRNSEALLCIVIDAADNAQMAANENGDEQSFARELLREKVSNGVRLVFLTRPYRLELLNPPPAIPVFELSPFSTSESANNLRNSFPGATDQDVAEFHRLSSHNPRVQATALADLRSLPEILRSLGPIPTTVEATISSLLQSAVSRIRDEAGQPGAQQIDRICQALATLRPLIPINVLSAIANVNESAVRSLVSDLQRPLLIRGDLIQFRDEPTETWFQKQFNPSKQSLISFLEVLTPLATQSVYVASVLPQLLLQAGQLDELVLLALSSTGLPDGNPLERRDLELQRLQFALKACLRTSSLEEAAKIALKAGGETAADDRQQELIQSNTDLAARFIEPDRMLEMVSRRVFGGRKWLGAHYAYEACFLSGRADLHGDARSRLRLSHEWLRHWASLTDEERSHTQIEDEFIAELALAQLNIHGPESCVDELIRWTPRTVACRVGKKVVRRLSDHSRFKDLEAIGNAAVGNLGLSLACISESFSNFRAPPVETVRYALRICRRVKLDRDSDWRFESHMADAKIALGITAFIQDPTHLKDVVRMLGLQFPTEVPRGIMSSHNGQRLTILKGYAVLERLRGEPITLRDLAHPGLSKEIKEGKTAQTSREVRSFYQDIGSLWPWCQLWARARLNQLPKEEVGKAIMQALKAYGEAQNAYYSDRSETVDDVALCWLEILSASHVEYASDLKEFDDWISSLRQPLVPSTITKIIWTLARSTSLGEEALQRSSMLSQLLVAQRTDASDTVQSLCELSRAVLPVSLSEANQYFHMAVEVANRIGGENLQRWDSVTKLAQAAADSSYMPELAYRFSRCAELTYSYVDRDKHFDWERTVRAMFGLGRSSGFAVLSRWRDRSFGDWYRLLESVTEKLLEENELDPGTAVALTGFRAGWNYEKILGAAFARTSSASKQRKTFEILFGRMRLEHQSSATWIRFQEVASSKGLSVPDFQELIADCKRREGDKAPDDRPLSHPAAETQGGPSWSEIFEGVDVTQGDQLATAYARFKSTKAPWSFGDFSREAISRCPLGMEAEFVRSSIANIEIRLFDMSDFLRAIPTHWRVRAAVKPALKEMMETFIERHCFRISVDPYYETLPFDLVEELTGLTKSAVAGLAVSAIGKSTSSLTANQLFTLVGLLALRLKTAQAQQALRFALDRFDTALKISDGDGDWHPELAPQNGMELAVAGYVWSALGSPEATWRWEAAHVVRTLCSLDRTQEILALGNMLQKGVGGAFADASLRFYELHAKLWLLIALERSARDNAAAVEPLRSSIEEIALNGSPHILIRHFAAKTAINLMGEMGDGSELVTSLQTVNLPKLPVVASKRYERNPIGRKVNRQIDVEKLRFQVGYEFKKYMPSKLGEHFGLSGDEIEERMAEVIWDDWGLKDTGSWEDDARKTRKLFEGRNVYRDDTDGRRDDLSQYLSHHSLMTVAGKLLAKTPLHEDPDSDWDTFSEWIGGRLLTRADGLWLSDRRDPFPLARVHPIENAPDKNWRWEVAPEDFAKRIGLATENFILHGRWTTRWGQHEEDVQVKSALVSPTHSGALMRALQTARSPYSHHLPYAGEDDIAHSQFQLKGWVVSSQREKNFDEYDPWAGRISYPPPYPAEFVCQMLNVAGDSESREWRKSTSTPDDSPAIKTRIWGHWSDDEESDYGQRGEDGTIIELTKDVVTELLQGCGMDLIVEVRIERRRRRLRYESESDETETHGFPYTGIYLIKQNGSIESLI